MLIGIDIPLRINIPSSKITEVYEALKVIRDASPSSPSPSHHIDKTKGRADKDKDEDEEEEEAEEDHSLLNQLITQLQDKKQWLTERQDLINEQEKWNKERIQLRDETLKKQQQQQQQQQQAHSQPSSSSN